MIERSSEFHMRPWVVGMLWVLTLPVLIAGLGTPVTQRTQEARVLETAREMFVSGDPREWLVPRLNDEVRLQKPPLAYWAAAGGFRVLGIGEFAGRLPFAVAGWLTLAVVYAFGKRLIDQRFGLLSAGIMLTSFMFFRHFRLAETDSLAALFVTASVYWLWRGAREAEAWRAGAFFHLAMAAAGLAVLAKGPPGGFPLLFFLAWVIVERRWTALTRFLLSGALLTGAVVAGSWFLAIRGAPEFAVLGKEIGVVTRGGDHTAPFYVYLPMLLRAPAPWTGLYVLGLIWAVAHWRAQPAMRVVLIWGAAIFVPLCLIGNKQDHYLVPLAPTLAMLTAYAVHRGLGADAKERAVAGWVTGVTLAIAFLTPVGVILAARQARGSVEVLDIALCVFAVVGGAAAVSMWRRDGLGAGVAGMTATLAIAFAVIFGRWLPSLDRVNHRTIAAEIRARYGDGPYAFYGPNESLPLVWNLRTVVRETPTAEELARALRETPRTVVIAQTKNHREPPPIPEPLSERNRFEADKEGTTFRIYRAGP